MKKSLSKVVLISHPELLMGEYDTIFMLFEMGLEQFHLRKTGFTEQQYQNFLNPVPKELREKIIVHQFPDLAIKYKLKGCHFKSSDLEPSEKNSALVYGKSAHTYSELIHECDYSYLSPIFQSISKPNYSSEFQIETLQQQLGNQKFTYALGGITDQNIKEAFTMGFQGVAVHGFIWEEIRTQSIKENFQRIIDVL